jgi:hypothetical protein
MKDIRPEIVEWSLSLAATSILVSTAAITVALAYRAVIWLVTT